MTLRPAIGVVMVLMCTCGCTTSTRQGPASTSVVSGSRVPGVTGTETPLPFPAPGDTSRADSERRKQMNTPTTGGITVAPLPPPGPVDSDSNVLPKFGDYVYVEEHPEALTRVSPAYPDEARRAGVDGTVMVQALVLRDGNVGDTRIVKSVPGLDDAAVAAVRQWRFKPGMAKGQPVAVWVGVPVRFTLH